jgi:hypothetical protein
MKAKIREQLDRANEAYRRKPELIPERQKRKSQRGVVAIRRHTESCNKAREEKGLKYLHSNDVTSCLCPCYANGVDRFGKEHREMLGTSDYNQAQQWCLDLTAGKPIAGNESNEHETFVKRQENAWKRHQAFVEEQEKAWKEQHQRDKALDERIDKLVSVIERLVANQTK